MSRLEKLRKDCDTCVTCPFYTIKCCPLGVFLVISNPKKYKDSRAYRILEDVYENAQTGKIQA